MDELERLRKEIDEIDAGIVRLFERRMAVTEQIGRYKQKNGLPVLDNRRQQEVLESKAALPEDPSLRADVVMLYETIMGLSRRQQRGIVREGLQEPNYARVEAAVKNLRQPPEHPAVAYQGVPGAYSEQAAADFFGSGAEITGLPRFEDVFLAIREGRADYGVVPIENNSTGGIRQIYDLLARYEFYLVGETAVRVEHCLCAPEGADLDTITNVYSHEQGLFQCERFLSRFPWKRVPQEDTAGSARIVAESGDRSKAAICSSRAAELYGLEILERNINTNTNNTTRFVIVSPVMELPEGRDKICISLTTAHHSGSLHEILTIFARHGLNLVKLESRPVQGKNWEYMFFIDFTGDLTASGMDGVIRELMNTAFGLRVFGNFRSNL